MIYAFCNLHDVSWGTKGDNKVVDDKPAVSENSVKTVLTFLFWSVAVLSLVRFIGCVSLHHHVVGPETR
ncbi:hypothetical protein BASA60_010996 [Batrachochytrium salamandrivorans]|nr:hypothetical protein BASA60_010996 [Batrachochytrium salamandrivorans]